MHDESSQGGGVWGEVRGGGGGGGLGRALKFGTSIREAKLSAEGESRSEITKEYTRLHMVTECAKEERLSSNGYSVLSIYFFMCLFIRSFYFYLMYLRISRCKKDMNDFFFQNYSKYRHESRI